MLRLHSLPHAQSQHHSNAQHGGEREERGGQGEAQVRPKTHQNKSQTITDKIAWKSLLGVIVGEGRRRLA